MTNTEEILEITEKHKAALHAFMDSRNLNPNKWCKKAGMAESTLRSFLGRDGSSIALNTLARLASVEGASISELIGEANDNKLPIDSQLLAHIMRLVKDEKDKLKVELTIEKEAELLGVLYDTGIIKRNEKNLAMDLQSKAHSILEFIKRSP